MNLINKVIFLTFMLLTSFSWISNGQDYGCDKCSMLREEYELAESPEKEEVYEYFKQECLDTDTAFVSESGEAVAPEKAETIQVTASGKCLDYKEVKQIKKSTGKEIMSYSVAKKDTVYQIATKNAAYNGGVEELVSYMKQNIVYPKELKSKKIAGTVYLRLVISSSGKITQVKVKRSPDELLSKEAIRCVNSMPNWIPGEYKGTPVSMVYVLPVRFSLP